MRIISTVDKSKIKNESLSQSSAADLWVPSPRKLIKSAEFPEGLPVIIASMEQEPQTKPKTISLLGKSVTLLKKTSTQILQTKTS